MIRVLMFLLNYLTLMMFLIDDDMIDEALDEVEKELTKQQRKNKKRREQMKQLKKGNKITEATPINEDVD